MNNENYDPRQDPEFLAFLDSRANTPPSDMQGRPAQRPAPRTYVPNNNQQRPVTQRTDKNGTGSTWDKTQQDGEVVHVIQRFYDDKKRGQKIYTEQLRVVIKDYKGTRYVALEKWKPVADDIYRTPDAQKHEWKGAVSVSLRDLRELGSKLMDMSETIGENGENR